MDVVRKMNISSKDGKRKSRLWYLVPIFIPVAGGLIGYFVARASNPALARNLLWTGIILSAAMAAVTAYLYQDFQSDMGIAYENIAMGSRTINTAYGPLEYADVGSGYPVLVVHGAGGGYDQGILLSQIFFGDDSDQFRVIAPSRFGFLNTPLPDGADGPRPSFAAQADALAELLDDLNIEKVAVIGFSAGGPSSIEFALRHPDKTSQLILVSAVVHEEPPMQFVDEVVHNGLFKSDFAFWIMGKYCQPQLLSFLGVTAQVQEKLTSEEKSWVSDTFIPSLNPISPRQPGMLNDRINFVSIDYPVEHIGVQTLVVYAKDDTLVNLSHSTYAVENIPDAEYVEYDSGGHILLGHHQDTKSVIVSFLTQ
jgi:2-hydroxy-6-oxonona-2,4-dienedioate hydrolase